MAEIVRLPKLSDTMTEGVVAKWHKKIGMKVSSGDLLADIETDKATMEYESFQEGIILYIGVKEGATAPVDSILCILGKKGEDYQSLIDAEKAKQKEEKKPEPKKEAETAVSDSAPTPEIIAEKPISVERTTVSKDNPSPISADNDRLKASPLARKIALDKGINLHRMKGSGDDGRIVKRDVEGFNPAMQKQHAASQSESYADVPLSQMRKTIARRLAESKYSAPHFYLNISIDMERMMDARQSILDALGVKLSYNDLVVRAAASALKQHPKVNASWQGDKIRHYNHINIGIAVAVDEGLMVPVLKFADGKTLSEISAETKELSKKAIERKLQPAEMEGSTFTISNLGMFGIESFTAIINPPAACILAVGTIVQKPVVKNNQIVAGHIMEVTLSCDHRAVDGATGALFLKTFKTLMENPVLLLGSDWV